MDDEYTGLLPRRFRRWAFAVLAAAGVIVGFYGLLAPQELAVWVSGLSVLLGLSSGVASVNTRGEVTRD